MSTPETPPPPAPSLSGGTATLLAARVASNAGFFFAVIVITRAFDLSQRGVFAFVSVSGIIAGTLGTLGIGTAGSVVAAREPARRAEIGGTLLAFGLVAGAVVGSLTAGVGWLVRGELPPGLGPASFVAAGVAVAATTAGYGMLSFLQGCHLHRRLALVTAVTPWLYFVALLVVEQFHRLTVDLAVCVWAGYWVSWCTGQAVVALTATGVERPRPALVRSWLGFGLRALAGTLSTFLNYRADQFLMGFIAAEGTLGLYSVAVNASEVLLYVPSVIGFVLLPVIARSSPEERAATTVRTVRRLIVVVLGSGIVAALIGPTLVPLVFGHAYHGSVVPFLWLVPGALGYAGMSAFAAALTASAAPGRASAGAIAALVVGLGLDIVLIPILGADGAAIAATGAFFVGGTTALVVYRRLAKFQLRELVPRLDDAISLGRIARTMVRPRSA